MPAAVDHVLDRPAGGRTVLVLPAWYPTADQPFSGPFVRDHVRAAAEFGHRMVVLVDEGPRAGVRGLVELSDERDGDVRVVRFAYRPGAVRAAGVLAALRVAWRLARASTPVDVIHAHVHRMGWVAVLAGAVLRRPVVISEHSSEWSRRLMTSSRLWRARFALRHAALVCPVNSGLQQAIESYGVRARFRVVPNAVDTHLFHPADAQARGSAIRLVNVALHVEVKGLDLLLRAFATVAARRPELRLEFVGHGPLTAELELLASKLGVGETVSFAGLLPAEEVAERLRVSDVFVLSSHSENLPLSVLEALCCGLPVVATAVGGVPEAVGDHGAIVPSGDVDALAGAIGDVSSRLDTFDREDVARRAAERWSFEAVGGVWDEIYRSFSR